MGNLLADQTWSEMLGQATSLVAGSLLDVTVAKWALWAAAVLYVVSRRPRATIVAASTWCLWMAVQVHRGGAEAFEAMQGRGRVALAATDRCSDDLLALLRAWGDFFLPFLADVYWMAERAWRSTTPEQRKYAAAALISGAITVKILRVVYLAVLEAKRLAIKKAADARQGARDSKEVASRRMAACRTVARRYGARMLFHGSFLVAGYVVWGATSHMPLDWLSWSLGHLIATVPALRSLLVFKNGNPKGTEGKVWLCYWAFWPVLSLLHYTLEALPTTTFSFGASMLEAMVPTLLPPGGADLQHLAHRGLLVFVLWLQVWEGCTFLQGTLRKVANNGLMEALAGRFGARGLEGLQLLRSGLSSVNFTNLASARLIGRLWKHSYLIIASLSVVGLLLAALVWLCYRVFSAISTVITLAIWCFAALDTANDLASEIKEAYPKKLAFWVLAMLWGILAKLPVIGVFLSIFTPFAFSLWLVAGEFVLQRVVLPLLVRLLSLVHGPGLTTWFCASWQWAKARTYSADSESRASSPPRSRSATAATAADAASTRPGGGFLESVADRLREREEEQQHSSCSGTGGAPMSRTTSVADPSVCGGSRRGSEGGPDERPAGGRGEEDEDGVRTPLVEPVAAGVKAEETCDEGLTGCGGPAEDTGGTGSVEDTGGTGGAAASPARRCDAEVLLKKGASGEDLAGLEKEAPQEVAQNAEAQQLAAAQQEGPRRRGGRRGK